MTERVAMIDGAIVAVADAKVSVYDRGFLYGDTVFEVLRAYRGVPFELDAHLARLAASAALVHLALPVPLPAIADEIGAALAAAGAGDAYVRITISRGEGPLGLDPSRATRPCRVIAVEPLPALPPELYARGLALASITTTRATEGTGAAAAKFGGYLANVLALRDARARGADDALLVDARGAVLEATAANVFAVIDGALCTPPVTCDVLSGITRQVVLELARGMLPAREARLELGEVAAADEVFLTSSVREIVPVARLDARAVGGGAPGPVTGALHHALRVRAGA